MVFICGVKIHSCQCLFPVHMNFKSFMKSILLTSSRFQFSAFHGCFQCVRVPGSDPTPLCYMLLPVFLMQVMLLKMNFLRTSDGN